jgi:hypothetical protein
VPYAPSSGTWTAAQPLSPAPPATFAPTPGPSYGAAPAYPSAAPTYPGAAPAYPSYPPSGPAATWGNAAPAAAPGYAAPATPGWGAPPAGTTWGAPAGGSPYAMPGSMPLSPAPNAMLEGGIQPPGPQWDPYAAPGTGQPTLLPQDPYLSSGGLGGMGGVEQGSFIGKMQRLLRLLRLDYVWMPGGGSEEMGVNDIDTSATFAIPFLYNSQSPLLITPGFGITLFNGPTGPPGSTAALVPPHEFDAYLDTAWYPQLTQWFGGELNFRIGVYSDFKKVTDESLRFQGKGLAVLGFSPSMKVKAGVWYLDRNRIKLLPAGGLVWTPNPEIKFDITFPDPKLAKRLTNYGNTEWWLYGRGEYGGDAWTVDTGAPMGVLEFDYNDIRTAVGLEFFRPAGLHGLFEVGLAWEREIYFRGGARVPLNACVFLRGGLTY